MDTSVPSPERAHAKTQILANYALEGNRGVITWQRPPSCDLTVNPKNSIAIRKALALDGLYLIPRAGFFGTGLDSFMERRGGPIGCGKQVVGPSERGNSFLILFEIGFA